MIQWNSARDFFGDSYGGYRPCVSSEYPLRLYVPRFHADNLVRSVLLHRK